MGQNCSLDETDHDMQYGGYLEQVWISNDALLPSNNFQYTLFRRRYCLENSEIPPVDVIKYTRM